MSDISLIRQEKHKKVQNNETKIKKLLQNKILLKSCSLFMWIRSNCLWVIESMLQDTFLLTINSLGVPSNNFINLRRMKN